MSRYHEDLLVMQSYDGVLLFALDEKTNILYIFSTGFHGEEFRYWALDFSKNLDLLNQILDEKIEYNKNQELHYLIINGIIPAKIMKEVNKEDAERFADYLEEESNKYIPELPVKDFIKLFKKYLKSE